MEKYATRIDKNGEEITKINSSRFLASLLLNLVNNLSERIHNIKCKYELDDKKFAESNVSTANAFLNTQSLG